MALLEISDFASGAVDLPKELKALHCATTTTETTIRSHIMVNGKKNNGKGRPVPRTEGRVRNEKMQIHTTGMYSTGTWYQYPQATRRNPNGKFKQRILAVGWR